MGWNRVLTNVYGGVADAWACFGLCSFVVKETPRKFFFRIFPKVTRKCAILRNVPSGRIRFKNKKGRVLTWVGSLFGECWAGKRNGEIS